jgi:pyruvate/2-oxoglutarate dehydrogenase complex dihydrolipoamide dehydrogenase (E3) component
MARIRRVIADGISFYEHRLDRDEGVTLFRGRAQFVDEHTIECADERIEFGHALIATGAAPYVPSIPGLDAVPLATSDDLLRATELPAHLVVLGAGAVPLEFAQIYRRLGAAVTIVQRGRQVASAEEPELAELLGRYLEEEGVEILTETAIERVELDAGRPSVVLADGRRVTGDRLLVGLGPAPSSTDSASSR